MTRPAPTASDLRRRDEAVAYLMERVNYERMPPVAYGARRFKLDRMRELLRGLGSPQRGVPVVHVAGTKGKGSTATMIAAVLTDAGYRTGLFTSPHFHAIEERFAVDGCPCRADELAELIDWVKPVVEAMDHSASDAAEQEENRPTYFEITTAIALGHFARRAVDVAVLEVGLGGRLDSTNVAEPLVSAITSISLDHTAQLGDSLEAIAAEKAGIIRAAVPVVSGVTQPGPRRVIRQTARRVGAPLIEVGTDFETAPNIARPERTSFDYRRASGQTLCDLRLAMPGRHQVANAGVALAVIDQLRQTGWSLPEQSVRSGLGRAVCAGRVEIVESRPTLVFDVAHNRASLEALADTLQTRFPSPRKWAVFAASEDKDLRGMLEVLLDAFDQVVFTRYVDNPRAARAETLAAVAKELTGREYPTCPTPRESWDWVASRALPEDLICVTGSFFVVAEIRRWLAC